MASPFYSLNTVKQTPSIDRREEKGGNVTAWAEHCAVKGIPAISMLSPWNAELLETPRQVPSRGLAFKYFCVFYAQSNPKWTIHTDDLRLW